MKRFLTKVLCSLVLMAGVFTGIDMINPAKAQTVPVTTFQTSYKAYNDRTSWRKKMTLAERCTDTQKIYGARPATPGNYPVLLYIPGTFSDWGGNREGQEIVKRAASLGFIAMTLSYDTNETMNETGVQRQAFCMFDQNHPSDGITTACSVEGADCSKGVVVTGYSQGGAIATVANNYTQNVKAVWANGLSAYIYPREIVPADTMAAPYGTRVLPNDKLVITMGQASSLWGKKLLKEDLPSLKQLTGADCGEAYDCIQPNGSGYYVVSNSEVQDGTADHAYWMQVNRWSKGALSFTLNPKSPDPGFLETSSTKWSLKTNLNWLKSHLN